MVTFGEGDYSWWRAAGYLFLQCLVGAPVSLFPTSLFACRSLWPEAVTVLPKHVHSEKGVPGGLLEPQAEGGGGRRHSGAVHWVYSSGVRGVGICKGPRCWWLWVHGCVSWCGCLCWVICWHVLEATCACVCVCRGSSLGLAARCPQSFIHSHTD